MKMWGMMFIKYLFNLVALRFAEEPVMIEGEKKKLPVWAIILIVVGGLTILCTIVGCLLSILAPALMGPAIGNVFSNIVEDLE